MPRRMSGWGVLLALGAAAACTSERGTAPAPTTDIAATDAELAAIGMAGTFFEAAGPLALLGGDMMGTGAGGPAFGPVMGGGTMMGGGMMGGGMQGPMTPIQVGAAPGMDVTVRTTFYDAAGAAQPRYDSLTTAKLVQTHAIAGTMTVRHDARSVTMAVQRSGETTVTGLLGRETARTINGSASGTVTSDATIDGRTTHAVTTSTDRTADLVLPVPAARGTYPRSGTVTHERTVTVTRSGEPPVTHTVKETATYDGTAVVKVTVTVDGQTRSCTRNLETRTTSCS